jgi:hypothetical protein
MDINPYESPRERARLTAPGEQVSAARYSPFLELSIVTIILAVIVALLFPAIQ